MAERTTLIKATLNSIINHVMQITYLPIELLHKLERYQRKFHLIRWESVTTSRVEGGLGIQNLRKKNQALLASTALRLFHSPSTLWASLLISKNISSNTKQTSQLSRSWKHVRMLWSSCQQGIVWRLSTGTNVNFWNDPWLAPRLILRDIKCKGL